MNVWLGPGAGVVAASPDGHFFAAGSLSGAAYVWEAGQTPPPVTPPLAALPLVTARLTAPPPVTPRLAAPLTPSRCVWVAPWLRVPTGRLVRTWPAHFKAVSAMCFAADGGVLVTAGEDTVVTAWSLPSLLDPAAGGGGGGGGAAPAPMYSWAEHSLPVTALACGGGVGNGGGGGGGGAVLVASASADRSCKLWTLGGGHLLRTVTLPSALTAVALDACEATLYAGAADGRVFEVPLNAAPPVAAGRVGGASGVSGSVAAAAVLEGHGRAVTALACTADGERVVSSSEDGTARVWDAASRQTTHILRHPRAAPITAIAMVPRARVAGDGTGGGGGGGAGGGEKRKMAPLAPFSRFASGGGGGASGGGAGGRGGKLNAWEGAPLVMRGCGAAAAAAAVTVAAGSGGGGGGGGDRGGGGAATLGKRARGEGDSGSVVAAVGGGGPATPGGGGGGGSVEDVAALQRRVAAAESDAAAAREEAASWKKMHGELRAFVADELVTREAPK